MRIPCCESSTSETIKKILSIKSGTCHTKYVFCDSCLNCSGLALYRRLPGGISPPLVHVPRTGLRNNTYSVALWVPLLNSASALSDDVGESTARGLRYIQCLSQEYAVLVRFTFGGHTVRISSRDHVCATSPQPSRRHRHIFSSLCAYRTNLHSIRNTRRQNTALHILRGIYFEKSSLVTRTHCQATGAVLKCHGPGLWETWSSPTYLSSCWRGRLGALRCLRHRSRFSVVSVACRGRLSLVMLAHPHLESFPRSTRASTLDSTRNGVKAAPAPASIQSLGGRVLCA